MRTRGCTSIRIRSATKTRLEAEKIDPGETFDQVVNRLIDQTFDSEPLSDEILKRIETGVQDIRQGNTRTLEEISKKIGI